MEDVQPVEFDGSYFAVVAEACDMPFPPCPWWLTWGSLLFHLMLSKLIGRLLQYDRKGWGAAAIAMRALMTLAAFAQGIIDCVYFIKLWSNPAPVGRYQCVVAYLSFSPSLKNWAAMMGFFIATQKDMDEVDDDDAMVVSFLFPELASLAPFGLALILPSITHACIGVYALCLGMVPVGIIFSIGMACGEDSDTPYAKDGNFTWGWVFGTIAAFAASRIGLAATMALYDGQNYFEGIWWAVASGPTSSSAYLSLVTEHWYSMITFFVQVT